MLDAVLVACRLEPFDEVDARVQAPDDDPPP
jgi:hypothetical protein